MSYINVEEQKKYQREWRAARRAEYLAGKSCVKCGSTDRLEIDHIDPDKKLDHRIWSWSDKRREAELAKCQVLCHAHHLEKTAKEKSKPIPHGTDTGYTRRKCRCAACTESHRIVKNDYRDRRRAGGLSYT